MDIDSVCFDQRDFVDIEQFQETFDSEGAKGIHNLLQQKQDELKLLPLNIAIIGSSGAGKSTFINAVRGLTSDDPDAAPTGCVETTREATAYAQPGNDMLKFWDLPGVGTDNFPQDRYLELIHFDRYDFFLILSAVRFTGLDMWLGREILQSNRQFFFVRTKIAMDVSNDRRTRPRTHDEDVLLRTIREDIEMHLRKNQALAPIFLIDSLRTRRFDFNQLEMQLIKDFPAMKRQALTLAMNSLSEDMIKEKIKVLRSEIWKISMVSAGIGAVPIPGVSTVSDMGIVMYAIVRYLAILGLDDASLKQTSKRTGLDFGSLTAMVHDWFPPSLFAVGSLKELTTFAASRGLSTYITEATKLVPIFGQMFGAMVSFGMLYRTLHGLLDVMEKLALKVAQLNLEAAASVEADSDDDL
ncbi:interferon-inducible GTPase 5-like [Paramacrobiotus metropolitanus]|uniref:interferon-inducible GTPase 5-like n=1 Tax=Paramacrobiotus metropolitanus TaxID=2943436 RepID=UPI002445B120|nr:interferon-inducible GTPase 5-like [Paramacrobiotus metropolitanus]